MTTLYQKYGGFSVVNKLVHSLYEKVMASENLAPYFAGIDMQNLMDHQTRLFSSILGGPVEYTGRQLKLVHARIGVTEAAFLEVAELIEETLEDLSLDNNDIVAIMKIIDNAKSDIVGDPA
jgi:hemoglobin